jgi:hypothetical protein
MRYARVSVLVCACVCVCVCVVYTQQRLRGEGTQASNSETSTAITEFVEKTPFDASVLFLVEAGRFRRRPP